MTRGVLLFGTQAELTKTVGLVATVPGSLDLEIWWTGQHPDLVPAAARDLQQPQMTSHRLSQSDQAATERMLSLVLPDFVLVQGDTRSALMGARAAAAGKVPLVHLEAGLRLSAVAEPEERIRREITRMADLHVASSPESGRNLRNEGVPGSVVRVGVPLAAIYLGYLRSLNPVHRVSHDAPYIVVTIHRASALDRQDIFAQLLTDLVDLLDGGQMVVVRRPDPRWRPLFDRLAGHSAIRVVDELLPTAFNALISSSQCVLTDSAGVEQECTYLGVPHVVLRPESELPASSPHTAVLDAGIVLELIRAALDATNLQSSEVLLRQWRRHARDIWDWVMQWAD